MAQGDAENGYTTISGYDAPAYAIDAQGIVHLSGAMTGTAGQTAFTLPRDARPDAFKWLTVNDNGPSEFGALFIDPSGFVTPFITPSGAVGLDGVEYSRS